ncbi:hypothetical protein UFOVP606_31 [uncultured Caudovirales phage]|uniref:Uncharacterized protein n=1 Tax=uncultured Caudovirales phage TaxID=2100421 RepID=A0A6J5N1B9_9CAUD|nr:hypothetical protein UFOVP606_31 [uncultured Caudovirales phage]
MKKRPRIYKKATPCKVLVASTKIVWANRLAELRK